MANKKRDPYLLKMFRMYNNSFFDNSLEEPDILQYKKMKNHAGLTTMESQAPTRIYIHSGLKIFRVLTQIVLIHEMAHLKLGIKYRPVHGMRFQALLDGLYTQGAYEDLI